LGHWSARTHTRARSHTHAHAQSHTRTRSHTHTRTHSHTHTPGPVPLWMPGGTGPAGCASRARTAGSARRPGCSTGHMPRVHACTRAGVCSRGAGIIRLRRSWWRGTATAYARASRCHEVMRAVAGALNTRHGTPPSTRACDGAGRRSWREVWLSSPVWSQRGASVGPGGPYLRRRQTRPRSCSVKDDAFWLLRKV
jgi:hypothetical protein